MSVSLREKIAIDILGKSMWNKEYQYEITDQILSLFPPQLTTEQKEYCECKDPRPYDRICVNCMKPIPAEKREYGKYERNQTLRNCLNYCRHRLKKHQNTGLHKIGCQLEFVEQLEREFFPKQPDIQHKPKDRIEELVGLINLDIMSNENRIVAKINELVDFINNRK